MAVTGTLYTYPENWRAFKALIAAQYSGAKLRVLSSPPHFHFGQTNRSPDFLRKFPVGKVPAFEGDDGFCVFESNAIAYYVSNEELRGTTRERAAEVVQWVNFADSDIVPPASTWVFPTLGIMHYNKQATEQAKEEVRRALAVLDARLRSRTFLVGERVSLADISVPRSSPRASRRRRRPEKRRGRRRRRTGTRRRRTRRRTTRTTRTTRTRTGPGTAPRSWTSASRRWPQSPRPRTPSHTCLRGGGTGSTGSTGRAPGGHWEGSGDNGSTGRVLGAMGGCWEGTGRVQGGCWEHWEGVGRLLG
uniref:Elongation factor 1-gamma n=2 Tax=Anas TaxID=8835 RepID=A0A8B9UBA7_9AVES